MGPYGGTASFRVRVTAARGHNDNHVIIIIIITIKNEREEESRAANTTSSKNEAGKPWKKRRKERKGWSNGKTGADAAARKLRCVSCSQIKPTSRVI